MVVVDKIEGFLEKDIKMLGFDLWGIETFGNGKAKTLRIFIDSIGSITLDDCARVSRHVGALLDVKELTESNYNLEVSSPGLDRKFFKDTQYCNYIGSNIKVRYKDSYNKYLSKEGTLEGVFNNGIIVKIKEEMTKINFDVIEKANLKELF